MTWDVMDAPTCQSLGGSIIINALLYSGIRPAPDGNTYGLATARVFRHADKPVGVTRRQSLLQGALDVHARIVLDRGAGGEAVLPLVIYRQGLCYDALNCRKVGLGCCSDRHCVRRAGSRLCGGL